MTLGHGKNAGTDGKVLGADKPLLTSPLPFDAFFNLSPLACSVARKHDGLVLAVNDAWVNLVGIERVNAVGKKTSEMDLWLGEEERAKFVAELSSEGGRHSLRLKDGRVHGVRLQSTELAIEGEACLVVFLEQVDFEQRAEKAIEGVSRSLQQRVELLEEGEKLARMGHWTNTDAGSAVWWSAGMYAIAGFQPKDVLTRVEGRSGIHPDDLPAWVEAREASDNRELEFRWLHPDGSQRWFRTRMGRTQFATSERSNFGVIQDITAERLATERLEQQLALVQNLTSEVPAVLFQGQVNDRREVEITFVNDAVRDILELDPEELKRGDTQIFSRIDELDRKPLWAALRTAEKRMTPLQRVVRMALPAKDMRWCHVMAVPRKNVEGLVTWSGFIADVTESVRAAQVLERQHHMLEAVRCSQTLFIERKNKQRAYECLLDSLLKVSGSEHGFIGEIVSASSGKSHLKIHALTTLAQNGTSERHPLEQQGELGLEQLEEWIERAVTTGKSVISNEPQSGANVPQGVFEDHRVNTHLGIPVRFNDQVVAVVGLANKVGGYSPENVSFLQPLVSTVQQLVVAWREVVERQRSDEALNATTELLREKSSVLEDTLESINQGLSKSDAEGRFIAYNKRMLELLDLPEALMAARPTLHAMLAFQMARGDFGPNLSYVEDHARRFIQEQIPKGVPDMYLRRTQDGRTLEFRSRPTADGGIVRTCSDVSSYIAAQEALGSERQRLEWILEATRPGTWETDQLSGHMVINARWAEMLGYTLEELAPISLQTWKRLLHPDDLSLALERHRAHCAQETLYFECDLRMHHKDGRWIWINTRGRVHRRDEQGKALFMSGTHIDITERVCAQDEVRALNASLELRVSQRTADVERTLKDMEAISYSIAHDLRAPLRAVNGFASVIADSDPGVLDAPSRDMFERIVRASRNMGQMLTDMLSLLEVVRKDLVPAPVDMGKVAQAAINALVEEKSPVQVDLQALPMALGDAGLLRQVLFNLIDNAVKYSLHQPEPKICIGHDPHRRAYFVRDNGMGFDMAHAGKLFGLFQRLHAGSTVPGMGVGLAIVARIIERHGGHIWAESKPGEGATFWWTLPLE